MSEATNDINLLAAIKNYLKQNYVPRDQDRPDVFFMSTQELTRKLRDLYPTNDLNETTVAEWMHELGFSFTDNGDMLLEWRLARF